MRIILAVGLLVVSLGSPGMSQDSQSPYAGFEARDIAALSAHDIAELKAGRGWGLALAAELNGYPGPMHVLELSEELALSSDQKAQIIEVIDQMRADAIAAGAELIAAEAALDQAFSEGGITQAALRDAVAAAGSARTDLRFVHLSRHLLTIEILDDVQIERYAILRGYAQDPCNSVPQGHDETMWRRHNGCNN
ncbi:hypothetical protein [uncultured Hoeflea sp.]|uniref:hypothetical protein n=1 Tax=uncultured Hoeflea sp. TaxID=538666 RepID=UPI0026222FAF|nr:hypothetical protein [uncultured Hoeflea sp.]